MTKSDAHKKAQIKAAGKDGQTEVKIKGNGRLDALTADGKRATEVERNGNFKEAINRLKNSGAKQKVLQVPQKDMKKAEDAMKKQGLKGTIKNMGGTKKKSV